MNYLSRQRLISNLIENYKLMMKNLLDIHNQKNLVVQVQLLMADYGPNEVIKLNHQMCQSSFQKLLVMRELL